MTNLGQRVDDLSTNFGSKMNVEASVEATRLMIAEMRAQSKVEKHLHGLDGNGGATTTATKSHTAAAINGGAWISDDETSGNHGGPSSLAVKPLGAPPSAGAIVAVGDLTLPPRPRDALMPVIPGKEQAKRAETPTEWLFTLRLEKYCEKFEALGVRNIHDFVEVGEADLKDFGLPLLQQRRFLTAVLDIPPPPMRALRAHSHVTELMARAERLSQLPSNVSTAAAFDEAALSSAVGEVAEAAQQLYTKSMEPAQWLEDFRLDDFAPRFAALGVAELVDFTEVTNDDLDGMNMPALQQRRFRHNAAAIPHVGSIEAIAKLASEVVATTPSHEAIAEWLRAVRLFNYYDAVKKLGARDASDLVEIEDDELARHACMPPLARRRFLACARVAVYGLCDSASEQARALATAAADQSDALDWMRTLRLNPWLEGFERLGAVEVEDMLEMDENDLKELGLPLVQRKRFKAALPFLPAPPDFPGRRWETPANWLESLRLRRFAGAFAQIGVDRVVDFAEVTGDDLADMGMAPLQRRRFIAAVAVDAQPSHAKAAASEAGKSTEARGATAGYDLAVTRNVSDDPLAAPPSRWLTTLRIESFLESFEAIGVERVIDFAEVVEEDLLEMGLPLLQRRRFRKAAALAEETYLLAKAAANENMTPEEEAAANEDAGRVQAPVEWLAEMRNKRFAAAFESLGVERVLDFVEVWEQDLMDMGMPLLNRRRFMKATAVLRDAVLAEI